MSHISHLREYWATREDRIVTTIIVALLLLLGYGIGYWSAHTQREIPIVFQTSDGGEAKNALLSDEDLRALAAPSASPHVSGSSAAHATGSGAYVASAQGTKYYTPECSEVGRIKEENRVWFQSEQEAKSPATSRASA